MHLRDGHASWRVAWWRLSRWGAAGRWGFGVTWLVLGLALLTLGVWRRRRRGQELDVGQEQAVVTRYRDIGGVQRLGDIA